MTEDNESVSEESSKKKKIKVTLPKTVLKKKKVTSKDLLEMQEEALIFIQTYEGQGYTKEQLKEWKQLGLIKPDFVKSEDWTDTDASLSPLQSVICHLSALVMSADQISQITGCSQNFVYSVTNSTKGKVEIQSIQNKLWGEKFQQMINKIVPLAIHTAVTCMLDPKTKAQTKVDAAFRFMDRAMGKPVQHIDVKENLIRSVYEKLDASRAVEIGTAAATVIANEIKQEEKSEEPIKPIDPVDQWLEDNL